MWTYLSPQQRKLLIQMGPHADSSVDRLGSVGTQEQGLFAALARPAEQPQPSSEPPLLSAASPAPLDG
jgi:hypothetical protein